MKYSPQTTEETVADLKARIAADVAKREKTEKYQEAVKKHSSTFLKKCAERACRDVFVNVAAVIGAVLVVGTALSVANS